MNLRERLADPHCYEKLLFPRSIEDMNHVEKEAELLECGRALAINVWQTHAQMEEVKARSEALLDAIQPPEQPFLHANLTKPAGFNLLKR